MLPLVLGSNFSVLVHALPYGQATVQVLHSLQSLDLIRRLQLVSGVFLQSCRYFHRGVLSSTPRAHVVLGPRFLPVLTENVVPEFFRFELFSLWHSSEVLGAVHVCLLSLTLAKNHRLLDARRLNPSFTAGPFFRFHSLIT